MTQRPPVGSASQTPPGVGEVASGGDTGVKGIGTMSRESQLTKEGTQELAKWDQERDARPRPGQGSGATWALKKGTEGMRSSNRAFGEGLPFQSLTAQVAYGRTETGVGTDSLAVMAGQGGGHVCHEGLGPRK